MNCHFIKDFHPVVKKHLFGLSCYDFLWADNMYKQSEEFLIGNPCLAIIHREVKRLLDIEEKIKGYPEVRTIYDQSYLAHLRKFCPNIS